MKRLFLLPLFCLALQAADEPKDAVVAAAKALAEKPNYAWSTSSRNADGSTQGGDVEGKTEKGGFTYYTVNVGGRTVELAFKGSKSAINLDGSWQTPEELDGQLSWVAERMKSFKPPAGELQEIVGTAKNLRKTGEGQFAADLSEEAVKQLLGARRAADVTLTNPKGTLKVWVKNGIVEKYEYALQGKIEFQGNERDIDRTTTVEIQSVGTTKVEVPADAKPKLS